MIRNSHTDPEMKIRNCTERTRYTASSDRHENPALMTRAVSSGIEKGIRMVYIEATASLSQRNKVNTTFQINSVINSRRSRI